MLSLFSMFSRFSVNLNIDNLRSSKAINIIGFHLIVCGCYHQIIQLSKITRLFHENRCLCTNKHCQGLSPLVTLID